MNRKQLIICLFLLSFLPLFVNSQVVQRGVVKEYNGRHEKTPLSNVSLVINNAGSTMSDNSGEFRLQFRTLKAGDKVKIEEIYKEGYELFNKDAIEQWVISNNDYPFTIVMCQSSRIKALKDQYAKVSYESYARQQKREEEKLAKEREEGKLKDTEYKQIILQIKNSYAQKLEDIHSYFEKFALIDLSELSEVEADIIELIQKGNIEEAIRRYDDLNLDKKLQDISDKITKENAAVKSINNIIKEDLTKRDSLFMMFMRSVNTLALAGGSDNFKAILEKLKKRADYDSTYVAPMIAYAEYCMDQKLYSEAIDYYSKAEKLIEETDYKHLRNIPWLKAEAQEELQHISMAEKELHKALRFNELYASIDSIDFLNGKSALLSDRARICFYKGQIDSAFHYYDKALVLAEEVAKRDSNFLMSPWMVRMNIADKYSQLEIFDKADSIYTMVIDFFEDKPLEEYKLIVLMSEMGLARSLMNQGNYKDAESPICKWIAMQEENERKNPSRFGSQVLVGDMMLLKIYAATDQIKKLNTIISQLEEKYEYYLKLNPEQFQPLYLTYKLELSEVLISKGPRYYSTVINSLENCYTQIEEWYDSNPDVFMPIKISCTICLGAAYAGIGNMEKFESLTVCGINLLDSITIVDEPFMEPVLMGCYNLGQYYYSIKKYEESEKYLRRFIKDSDYDTKKLGTQIVNAFEMLEEISIINKKYDKALICVHNIRILYHDMEIYDKDAMLYLSEARLLLDMNKKKDARKSFKMAESLDASYVKTNGGELRKMIFGK